MMKHCRLSNCVHLWREAAPQVEMVLRVVLPQFVINQDVT